MESNVIQEWNHELKEVLGKDSLEKLTLFFEFLEMPKKKDKDEEIASKICEQILNAMEDFECGRIGETECLKELLLTEQYLGMLCSHVDPSFYSRVRYSNQRFAELIKWIGDYPLRPDGSLDLRCERPEDSEKYPVPKKYWALAYWGRNTDAHEMLAVNRRWSMQIKNAILYVMISSTWKYKNLIKTMSSELEIESFFPRDDYMKQIVKEYENDRLQKTFIKMSSVVYDTNDYDDDTEEEHDQVISATDILKSFNGSVNYVRLVGEAGIGKSRLMRHLEYLDAKNKEFIPIYVELKNLVNISDSPLQLLAERLNVPEEICDKILSSLKVHVFLDGVNEMICPDKEKFHICRKLDDLANKYPKADFLISDRENSAVWISNDIPTYLLCRLDPIMQEQFIDRNCEQELAEKVKILIREDEKLGQALSTPILLIFFIETVRNGGFVKGMDSTKAVSRCYVKGLIDREVRSKGETRAKKIEYLLSALIASADPEPDKEITSYKEGTVLREFKKCADEYGFSGIDMAEMIELVTQMGFLRPLKDGRYMFSNKLLEDYFVDYALEKGMLDYE